MDTDKTPEKTENIEIIEAKYSGVNPKSLNNLKPWVKGQNPNPNNIGKKVPKVVAKARHDLIKILQEQMELNIPQPLLEKIREYYPKTTGKMSTAEAVMMRLVLAAISGEAWAIKEVLDRTQGAVKQTIKQDITIGPKLDELSDDELDQAIKNTAIDLDAGEGTPALPE